MISCFLGPNLWSWPRGMQPHDSWIQDPEKIQLITKAQNVIDQSEINYHELSLTVDFKLNNLTIVRYLEGNLVILLLLLLIILFHLLIITFFFIYLNISKSLASSVSKWSRTSRKNYRNNQLEENF